MNRKNCKHEETDSAARVGGNTVCDAKSLCVGASGPRDGGPYRRRAPYEKGQGQSGQVARRRVDRLLRLVARRLQTADARRSGLRSREGRRMHQLPHTFSVDAEGEVVPGNRWPGTDKYLANCLYYIEESADMLKNRIRELDDSTRLARIQLIVHCVGDHALSGAYPLSGQYDDRLLQGRLFRQGDALSHHLGFGDRPSVPIRGVSPIWRGCSTGIRRRNRPRSPRVRSTTGGANRPRRRSASTTCSRASPLPTIS